MSVVSREDRVALWDAAIGAEPPQRPALLHVLAREVADVVPGPLDRRAELAADSLELIDAAGYLADAELRRAVVALDDGRDGVNLLLVAMVRLSAAVSRVEAIEPPVRERAGALANAWASLISTTEEPPALYISVSDLADRYAVTTQAVYKWLKDGRIEARRSPGGSWLIPAAQFDEDPRPATSRSELDALRDHLVSVHAGVELPPEEEMTAGLRRDS